MRGTVSSPIIVDKGFRITPAHAGNRMQKITRQDLKKDHPRSCGEQATIKSQNDAGKGSPPLMRGTVASYPATT